MNSAMFVQIGRPDKTSWTMDTDHISMMFRLYEFLDVISNGLWKHRPGHKPIERNIKMSGEHKKMSALTYKYLPYISR